MRGIANTIDKVLLGIILCPAPEDMSSRFLTCPKTGCWEHELKLNRHGYRRVSVAGKCKALHRVIYEHFRGPIPEGLEPDHLCRNRGCCNPDHIQPVPGKVNTLRSSSGPSKNAAKTHCLRGHPLNGANLYVPANGSRQCRECMRERNRRYREQEDPIARLKAQQQYRDQNREVLRERAHRYREMNPEKCKESQRRWEERARGPPRLW